MYEIYDLNTKLSECGDNVKSTDFEFMTQENGTTDKIM